MILKRAKRIVGVSAVLLGCGVLVSNASVMAQADSAVPQMDVMVRSDVDVPPAERSDWAKKNMAASKMVYQRVQNMLDRARREKDSIKITCLDDKLTQIHVNLRGIEERSAAFETSLSSNDTAASDQQFTVLKIYVSRVQSLKQEAENCIGDSDVVVGNSETVVTVDEDITIEDPSREGQDIYQQVGVDQLPHASGYY